MTPFPLFLESDPTDDVQGQQSSNPTPTSTPSLKHRINSWGYIALAIVIVIVSAVIMYGIYSCYSSATVNENARHSHDGNLEKGKLGWRKPRRLRKKRKSDIQQPFLSSPNMSETSMMEKSSFDFDHPSLSAPPLAHHTTDHMPIFPLLATQLQAGSNNHSDTLADAPHIYDSHNIRFVPPLNRFMSPSAAMIWRDPKLSPIRGSIIPQKSFQS